MQSTTETETRSNPALVLRSAARGPFREELFERLTSHNPLLPLPESRQRDPKIAHAPKRSTTSLDREGKKVQFLSPYSQNQQGL